MSEPKNKPSAEIKAAATFWIIENRTAIEALVKAGHTYPQIAAAVAKGIGVKSFPDSALRPIFAAGGIAAPNKSSRGAGGGSNKRLMGLIDVAYESIAKLEARVSALEIAQAKESGNLI